MAKYYNSVARLFSIKRLNNSINGNPRYRILVCIDNYLNEGITEERNAITKSDAPFNIDCPCSSYHQDGSYPINICYHITQAGRCIIDSIPHNVSITAKFMNRIEED